MKYSEHLILFSSGYITISSKQCFSIYKMTLMISCYEHYTWCGYVHMLIRAIQRDVNCNDLRHSKMYPVILVFFRSHSSTRGKNNQKILSAKQYPKYFLCLTQSLCCKPPQNWLDTHCREIQYMDCIYL